MEKLMKKYNNSRRNGGFSLVELIIVIAIMAALVAVLAPQYIKYIEKSRVAADQNTITEFQNAIRVAAADEDFTLTTGKKVTIGIAKSTATTKATSTDDATGLGAALTQYYGANWQDAYLKSKGATACVITVTIGTDKSVTLTTTGGIAG